MAPVVQVRGLVCCQPGRPSGTGDERGRRTPPARGDGDRRGVGADLPVGGGERHGPVALRDPPRVDAGCAVFGGAAPRGARDAGAVAAGGAAAARGGYLRKQILPHFTGRRIPEQARPGVWTRERARGAAAANEGSRGTPPPTADSRPARQAAFPDSRAGVDMRPSIGRGARAICGARS